MGWEAGVTSSAGDEIKDGQRADAVCPGFRNLDRTKVYH